MLTAVERVLILRGADLLQELGPRHLLRLAEVAREVEIGAGDTLYEERDAADALYLVVDGRVRLMTGDRATSEVGPGEAFGTWALVDDSERGHRAECVEDALVLALPRSEFYEVAAGDLAILQELVRVLAKRLRTMASERPQEEARVGGEGLEQPAAAPRAGAADVLGETTSTPGSALEAAALGQPSAPPAPVPIVVSPTVGDAEILAPEPIVPPAIAEPEAASESKAPP